jgi:uncharacterized protein
MVTAGLIFAWSCALVVGYCVNQGGTCAVAAARDLVEWRQVRLFLGTAVATGAAGMVLLPSAWALGMGDHIAGSAPLGLSLLLGGVLLGVGSVINDGCLLGSLWRLGNGELRLLALPVGLALGFGLAERGPIMVAPKVAATELAHPSTNGLGIVVGSAILLGIAALLLRRFDQAPGDRWPLWRSMSLLGFCGALLYVIQPSWSYADVVHHEVSPTLDMMRSGWGEVIAAALTVIGAALSAMRLRVFKPKLPTPVELVRTLVGGTLIALGATTIPGGNDRLLLSSVPGGSISGAVAYTTMTLVVVVTVAITHWIGGAKPTTDL